MEDNKKEQIEDTSKEVNLEDKLKTKMEKTFEVKDKKENNGKVLKVLAIILGICLLIASLFWIGLFRNKNTQLTQQSKIQSENSVVSKIESLEGNKRPEILTKKFDTTSEIPKEKKNTAEEYKFLKKETKEALVSYYKEKFALDTTFGAFPSEEDGFFSDIDKKKDGELIAENWVPITQEEIITFVAHELEKRLNNEYGYEEIPFDVKGMIKSITIHETALNGIPKDNKTTAYVPTYILEYEGEFNSGRYYKTIKGFLNFTIDEENGGIKWK